MTSLEPIRTWPDTVPDDSRTLGWSVLDWVTDMILQPDGPRAGEPFKFTPEQVRIVLRWYEIDESGGFTRRSGTVRRLKGWGLPAKTRSSQFFRLSSFAARAVSAVGTRTECRSRSRTRPRGFRLPRSASCRPKTRCA